MRALVSVSVYYCFMMLAHFNFEPAPFLLKRIVCSAQKADRITALSAYHTCFFSSLRFRDYLYFYQNVFGKCFYRNAGACGLFREIVAVYGVECGKVVHVG